MQLFIGHVHTPTSRDRYDFDYLIAKTTEAEVITTIKLEYVRRVVDTGLETEDELDSLKALLNVNSNHTHIRQMTGVPLRPSTVEKNGNENSNRTEQSLDIVPYP